MNSIADFNNIDDYIYMFNGSILAELIIIIIVYYTKYFNSKILINWYENYRLSAVIADIFILVIGMIITRWIFTKYNLKYTLIKFLSIILIVQIVHDILFYLFFKNVPIGKNNMLDLFKKYASEVGYKAILGDSFMIVIAVLSTLYFSNKDKNTNIIYLITMIYLIPYIIYTK